MGTCQQTGLVTSSIDGIIASLTIHHWQNLDHGFSELSRVLRKNGLIVIFTSTPKQMKGYWLNHYFPEMLSTSILQMPALEKIDPARSFSPAIISGNISALWIYLAVPTLRAMLHNNYIS